jgi:succinate-semialdehyde dehydrogenase/glutarate-semialdehyde dehydrogenase
LAVATINPATGELIKSFEPLTDSQIEEKMCTAEQRFPEFRALTFAERGRMMMKGRKERTGEIDDPGNGENLPLGSG